MGKDTTKFVNLQRGVVMVHDASGRPVYVTPWSWRARKDMQDAIFVVEGEHYRKFCDSRCGPLYPFPEEAPAPAPAPVAPPVAATPPSDSGEAPKEPDAVEVVVSEEIQEQVNSILNEAPSGIRERVGQILQKAVDEGAEEVDVPEDLQPYWDRISDAMSGETSADPDDSASTDDAPAKDTKKKPKKVTKKK